MYRLLIGLLALAPALPAQEFRGSVLGRVTDPSGAFVIGAEITVTNQATGVAVKVGTNQEGYYQAPFLQPGVYIVKASMTGFKPVEHSSVRVGISTPVTLDITMEIGALTESVVVTAEAPLLNTTNADVGQVVQKDLIDTITVNLNRNILAMAQLAGVTGTMNRLSDNALISISGGGSTRNANEVMIDGVPTTTFTQGGNTSFVPSMDSVEEVKVQTTMFDAAYSHSNGGLISMSTRAGTNEWHGTGYLVRRWTALNANSWQNNRNRTGRAATAFRQYGGVFGGPVHIPKVYNGRNRTFFLVAVEKDRDPGQTSQQGRVPSELERAGNFSQTLSLAGGALSIYDPQTTVVTGGRATRQPFPNATIPASRLSPTGAAVLKLYPLPNQGVPLRLGLMNWAAASPRTTNQQQWKLRLDHNFTGNHKLFVAAGKMDRYAGTTPFFPGAWEFPPNQATVDNVARRGYPTVVFDDTVIVSPSLFTSIRYGFARRSDTDMQGAAGNDPAQLNLPSVIVSNQARRGWPYFRMFDRNGRQSTENLPFIGTRINRDASNTQSILATVTKIAGPHSLRFGGDYRLADHHRGSAGDAAAGIFNFDPLFTQADPYSDTSGQTSGTAMASLLLGLPMSGSLGFTSPLSLRAHYLAGFVQDDWRVSSRLTVNMGLRWEAEIPFTERFDRTIYGFDYGARLPLDVQVGGRPLTGGVLFAGVGGNPRRQGRVDRNNFGPRLGFAYRLGSKTVVRAGYGLFYSSGVFNQSYRGQIGTFDAVTQMTGSPDNGATVAATLANPFPSGLSQPLRSEPGLLARVGDSLQFLDQNRVLPYNQQWQAGVQRELPGRLMVEASYIGMLTLKQLDQFNLNERPDAYLALGTAENTQVDNPFFGKVPATTPLGRSARIAQGYLWAQYPQFAAAGLFGGLTVNGLNTGKSVYRAVQIRADKRLSHGVNALVTYTWSRLEDNNAASVVNPRDYRSVSQYDQTHVLRVASTWQLPARFAGSGAARSALRAVAGGWAVSGYLDLGSGTPIGVTHNNGRPNLTGDPATPGSTHDRLGDQPGGPGGFPKNPYINPNAFQPLASRYAIPTEKPYLEALRGPWTNALNVSLFKFFRLWAEGAKLEIRAESTNVTNTPNFGAPNTNLSNPAQFGTITTAGAGRLMQMTARVRF